MCQKRLEVIVRGPEKSGKCDLALFIARAIQDQLGAGMVVTKLSTDAREVSRDTYTLSHLRIHNDIVTVRSEAAPEPASGRVHPYIAAHLYFSVRFHIGGEYVWFARDMDLPCSLYPGMLITVGGMLFSVDHVRYQADQSRLLVRLHGGVDLETATQVKLEHAGWTVSERL